MAGASEPDDNKAADDLWTAAFKTLSDEDQERFVDLGGDFRGVLSGVRSSLLVDIELNKAKQLVHRFSKLPNPR
jgi:hypothetical protein